MNLLNYKNIIMVIPRSVQGILGAIMVSKKIGCVITNTRSLTRDDFKKINKMKQEGTAVVYLNIHINKEYCEMIDLDMDHYFILKPIDTMFIPMNEFHNIKVISVENVIEILYNNTIHTPFNHSLKNIVSCYYKNVKCAYYKLGKEIKEYIIRYPELTIYKYEKYIRTLVDKHGILQLP